MEHMTVGLALCKSKKSARKKCAKNEALKRQEESQEKSSKEVQGSTGVQESSTGQ